ncbi:hypothetical protein D9M68_856310 [compost metagenome]
MVLGAELRGSGARARDRQVGGVIGVTDCAGGNLSHVRFLPKTEKPRGDSTTSGQAFAVK